MAIIQLESEITQFKQVVVDIADLKVSVNPDDVLITYSLGSCLGLSIYDPVAGVAGLAHYMLPLSKIDPGKAALNPGMFVDSGVPALLEAAFKHGATKQNLIIKAAGCGQPLDNDDLFRTGERNHAVLKKILWKNNLLLAADHIGGKAARTIRLNVSTGETTIRIGGPGCEYFLL